MNHYASHGFIAIASSNHDDAYETNVGFAEGALGGNSDTLIGWLLYMKRQNTTASSSLYQRIGLMGAAGHSSGGA